MYESRVALLLETVCRDYTEAAWRDRAVCQEPPYSLWEWIPDELPEAMAAYKRVCMSCSVRSDCERYAIDNHCEGIWAGRFYPSVWWRSTGEPIVELDIDSIEGVDIE